MIIIYRLEHKDTGIGPFQMGYSKTLSPDKRSAWLELTTHNKRELDALPGEYYGCISEQSIYDYFGDFLPELLSSGYEIGKYAVSGDKIRYGKKYR